VITRIFLGVLIGGAIGTGLGYFGKCSSGSCPLTANPYRGAIYGAVMDWFSRYVLSWEISITLESEFCISALKEALSLGKPEIFNTDQGSQFTSIDFTKVLLDSGVRISMDGKGRVFDNIFIERLWRTVKVEDVYLRDYQTVTEARYNLGRYFELYNNRRLHQALGYPHPRRGVRRSSWHSGRPFRAPSRSNCSNRVRRIRLKNPSFLS